LIEDLEAAAAKQDVEQGKDNLYQAKHTTDAQKKESYPCGLVGNVVLLRGGAHGGPLANGVPQ
jgi:hypothetical protein